LIFPIVGRIARVLDEELHVATVPLNELENMGTLVD
jgi:hypothetical protein